MEDTFGADAPQQRRKRPRDPSGTDVVRQPASVRRAGPASASRPPMGADGYYGSMIGTGLAAVLAPDGGPRDQRLRALPAALFFGRDVLHVGCSAGYTTMAIGELFRPARILGIDSDASRVRKARAMLRGRATAVLLAARAAAGVVASPVGAGLAAGTMGSPSSPLGGGDVASAATERGADVAEAVAAALEVGPLSITGQAAARASPAEVAAALGRLDAGDGGGPAQADSPGQAVALHAATARAAAAVASDAATAVPAFPRNTAFRVEAAAGAGPVATHGEASYDVVLCFGAARRAHIEGGDAGLDALLGGLAAVLRPGGVLVMEPGTWKDYKKRRSAGPEAARAIDSILVRPTGLPDLLQDRHGFRGHSWVQAPPLSDVALGLRPAAGSAPARLSEQRAGDGTAASQRSRRLLLAFK